MMAEVMGFSDLRLDAQVDELRNRPAQEFSVIIIGAGVSGLLAARKIQELHLPVVVLEKNSELGGTWFENRYPGCGVDTPSHLYSFSSFRRDWSTYFGKRDEVLSYLNDMAGETDLRSLIEFDTRVLSARYNDVTQMWKVTSSKNGEQREFIANFVITAVGQLNLANIPELPGRDEYKGLTFHASDWPPDLDVTDKDVAIVGSAATAMQIVPAIADQVSRLTILQRSPQWIAPTDDYFREVSADMQWLMSKIPFYYEWFRLRLAWIYGDRVHESLQVDPSWPHQERSINATNDAHRRLFTDYLKSELAGRDDLIDKTLPKYPPFGKRMLLDNGWYASLKHPNVELFDEPMVAFTNSGIRSLSGEERDADIIVFATGFEAQRFLYPIDIRGRSDQSIREVWGDDDGRAYLGITTPGFPNLAFMYGPNTNLGHGGSYIFIAECQVRYILGLITEMVRHNIGSIECRSDVNDAYNKELDEAHDQMIYSHTGMSTWYRNSRGRVVTNSPWRIVDYWNMTRRPSLDDYEIEPANTENEPANVISSAK